LQVLAALSLAYAAARAVMETEWKRLLAYLSLAHMSLVVLGIAALNPMALRGSVLHLINHGVWMGALFVTATMLPDRLQTGAVPESGALWTRMPVFTAALSVIALASAGIPLLNGFVSESLIVRGVASDSGAWGVAAVAGAILIAAATVSGCGRAVFSRSAGRTERAIFDVRRPEYLTLAPLIATAIWIGISPAAVLSRINLPVLKVAARVDPAYAAEFEAACDTTVTPEMKAASPANQFLAAAPCGPDGQPLTPGTVATPAEPATPAR
jgi:NADH-quinone oxidoreductase subunit M